ncbi:fused DSP-PTPase phosphatase/NAD kinase-like protein [Clostridium tarantellae]|uniref:Phosphatase n=1 Tax=Clostridium tarantellae TaxID=39493 RepID=A0A6I1MMM5_9CLOT|nr:dual specificity protein phosphatase family protein [Clostridium tarantellae]MPQ44645.1 phosphatase [Clostridium tarantellae]
MKKFNKILFTYLLLFTFLFPVKVNAKIFNLANNTLSISDKDISISLEGKDKCEYPKNFRIIEGLNMSGSAQFTPSQLLHIKDKINSTNLYVVDLRQESHGFINNKAINFYTKNKKKHGVINKDLSSEQTLSAEKKLLETIKPNSDLTIYKKSGKVDEVLKVETVLSEQELTKKHNIKYKRLAIRDGHTPELATIDEFVEFIKTLPKDAHLHFHCKHGKGRTTSFMALFQMMNNKENLSIADILNQQLDEGGIDLKEKTSRKELLEQFYKYVKENKTNNYTTPFSKWVKST